MSTTASAKTGVNSSICQQLESQIKNKQGQITKWKQKYEELLNDTTNDLEEILNVKNILSDLDKEILKLKDDQRKNGCPRTVITANSLDSQTMISMSLVRRKDSNALNIVPMPPPGTTSTP